MDSILKHEFDQAVSQSNNLHLSNVKGDFLPVFVRVATINAFNSTPAIELIVNGMQVHRSNLVSGLFMLMRLAEISIEMRQIVLLILTSERLEYYCQDNDKSIAGNARILRSIIFDNKRIADFPSKINQTGAVAVAHQEIHIGTQNTIGSLHDSTVNIAGDKAKQSVSLEPQHKYTLIIIATLASTILLITLWMFGFPISSIISLLGLFW